jgi:hypothetical protein
MVCDEKMATHAHAHAHARSRWTRTTRDCRCSSPSGESVWNSKKALLTSLV